MPDQDSAPLVAAQGYDPSGARGAFGGAEAWAFFVSVNFDLIFGGNFTLIRFYLARVAWHPYV